MTNEVYLDFLEVVYHLVHVHIVPCCGQNKVQVTEGVTSKNLYVYYIFLERKHEGCLTSDKEENLLDAVGLFYYVLALRYVDLLENGTNPRQKMLRLLLQKVNFQVYVLKHLQDNLDFHPVRQLL